MLGNPLRFFSGPNICSKMVIFRAIFGPFLAFLVSPWRFSGAPRSRARVLNPVRVPASTASLLGEAVRSTGAVRFPGRSGCQGWG